MTVSEPAGAFEAGHEPFPDESWAVHRVVVPTVNVTEPVGVPVPDWGKTLAENVTDDPTGAEIGLAVAFTTTGEAKASAEPAISPPLAALTVSHVVPEHEAAPKEPLLPVMMMNCESQVVPPSVVVSTLPEPPPMSAHEVEVAHAAPSNWGGFEGSATDDHVVVAGVAADVVSMATPAYVEPYPAIMQNDAVGQVTPATSYKPLGTVSPVHVAPPSLDPRMTGVRELPLPTMTHVVADVPGAHEIPLGVLRDDGRVPEVQLEPPSVVTMTAGGLSTMAQSEALAHEMCPPWGAPEPGRTTWLHVEPPSDVTSATPAVPVEATATHAEAVGHDTSKTSDNAAPKEIGAHDEPDVVDP